MRVIYLFIILCLCVALYFVWQWGLVQQDRAALLVEQNQLRAEMVTQLGRYDELMRGMTDSCQVTLLDLTARLGLHPYQDTFEVMESTTRARLMGGIGGGSGIPEKPKVAKAKRSKR